MNNAEIKTHLIFFTQNIVDLRDQNIYDKIEEYFDRTVFLNNIDFLVKNTLVTEDEKRNCIYSVTDKGKKFLTQMIEEDKYLAEKEKIEFEKSKIDLVLAQKMLKEYPYTKFLAIIGAVIGILLGLKELGILIKKHLLL
jgi:predicted transcriptional regulator